MDFGSMRSRIFTNGKTRIARICPRHTNFSTNFVLTWTMLVNGAAVTFTSRAAECTIGMAVAVKAVHGTFVCKELRSPDGKHVVDLRGSYTT